MIIFIIEYAIACIYLLLNFKHDIQMLQQNSYRLERYWKYLKKNDIGSAWRLTDVALLFLLFSTLLDYRLSIVLIVITCLCKIFLIINKKHKKPLVFTKRVWRIYIVTTLLAATFITGVFIFTDESNLNLPYPSAMLQFGSILLISLFSWLIVMLAVVVLMPYEKLLNKKYWNEAAHILNSHKDLIVIGITGSYGKTSTKHYLNRILSEEFDVLMTPGSYNTPMGVIRTVREMMKPYNNVFICEMGAKQNGDIKEICDLVHPQIGIITAVGPMHLETFKTISNVQSTKFELADSLPDNGFLVINNDFEYCANRVVSNVETARYSLTDNELKDVEYKADDIKYSSEGTTFVVKGPQGLNFSIKTRLLGACNISNLLGAIITALKLGMTPDKIRRAIADIEQVEHRLSIKKTPGGITILDDAFNSNPDGSRMALEVLSEFKGGRRIVITPGMIELGDKQNELNEKFGEEMAEFSDIAIIVGEYNRDSIVRGIKRKKFNESNLHLVADFQEAQQLLSSIMKSGDTVLYENDLPDTFK